MNWAVGDKNWGFRGFRIRKRSWVKAVTTLEAFRGTKLSDSSRPDLQLCCSNVRQN
jgi:hypothetical protein